MCINEQPINATFCTDIVDSAENDINYFVFLKNQPLDCVKKRTLRNRNRKQICPLIGSLVYISQSYTSAIRNDNDEYGFLTQ